MRTIDRTLLAFALLSVAALAVLGATGFLLLGDAARLDMVLHQSALSTTRRHGIVLTLALCVTALGSGVWLTCAAFGGAAMLAAGRRWREAAWVLATSGLGAIGVHSIKQMIDRPRSDLIDHLVHVDSPSFPSAHSANAAIVYGVLALLAGRRLSNAGQRALAVSLVTLLVAIGLSRIALGVHWPTDVLAGWSLGAGWALASAALLRATE